MLGSVFFNYYNPMIRGLTESFFFLKVAPASSGKYFVTAGLDRYLRIFDVTNPKPVHRMYMKSKLNCLLVSPGVNNSVFIHLLFIHTNTLLNFYMNWLAGFG